MLYLVKGVVEISHYMIDESESTIETRIVEADSDFEAENKFADYFRNKTEEYAVYYSVSQVESSEMIK